MDKKEIIEALSEVKRLMLDYGLIIINDVNIFFTDYEIRENLNILALFYKRKLVAAIHMDEIKNIDYTA